jgi:hypothetical protein
MTDVESIVELDIGVTPEAAVSGAVLLQTEERAFLMFNAMRDTLRPTPHGGSYKEDAGRAIVELVLCSVTKFGYPNDEAWSHIPRTRGLAYGVFEVLKSSWISELTQLNRHGFPNTPEPTDKRHFLFLFHDSSFECIARELRVEIRQDKFYEIFATVSDRAFSHGAEQSHAAPR